MSGGNAQRQEAQAYYSAASLEGLGSVGFVFPKVGPFAEVGLKYAFEYSQLDYQPYQKTNAVEASATYQDRNNRVRFGGEYSDNKYYRDAESLDGPEAEFFFDYRRRLPL